MATIPSSPKEFDTEKGSVGSSSGDAGGSAIIITDKSQGVRKMELLSSRINMKYLLLLYGGFTILAYVMSLDQYTQGTYLTTATSVSFSAHSTLATIRTIKSVFQAVSQPPIAKIADVAGRVEAYVLCVVLYALGYIIAASANSIYAYAVGNSIYILGITGLFLLQNIIISDISSLRNRLFWSIFPSLPGAINVWISGDVASGVLATSTWRWGLGMFCIMTPVLAIPIIVTLGIGMRESKKPEKIEAAAQVALHRGKPSLRTRAIEIFWQLDFVGLVLLVAGAGLVLVTITIANSTVSRWSDAHCIAMLVVGGLCCVGFVAWERFGALHPLIPFKLLTDRTVIAALVIAVFHPVAGRIAGGYFYTFLVVAGNQSVKSATRIGNISGFAGTLTAVAAGVVARYTRRLKPIIVVGFLVQILGLGLMIRFRQSSNSQVELAMVQVVRGLGAGCIGFPVQAAIQSAAKHEHTAAITAGYLTIYYLSGGIGSAIGGGIWTNLVPQKLDVYMGNLTLSASAYKNPIGFIKTYAPGTVERMALARAQDEAQRIIVIVAVCMAVVGLFAALFIENVRLPDTQSRPEVEAVEEKI